MGGVAEDEDGIGRPEASKICGEIAKAMPSLRWWLASVMNSVQIGLF